MAGFNLEFPFAGRSDRLAFVKQQFLTTPNAANVRSKDPVQKRLRGAQRAGQRLLFGAALGGRTKVKDLASISVNNKKITYTAKSGDLTAATPESPVWTAATPSGSTSADLDVDRQGNIYVLDGPNALVKLNSAGKEIWRTALPVDDKDHVARGIHVDKFDGIYVGISTGGKQELAELWKYEQSEDDDPIISWTIKPERYVETMERYGDLLYTLQNDPENAKSYVVIYDRIDTTAPIQVKEVSVPYPAHDLSVGDDGAFYVASPRDSSEATLRSNTDGYFYRGINPQHPTYLTPSEDWTPKNLDDYEDRIWAWYRADDIQPEDVEDGVLQDGKEVLRWRDISGHGRHLYACRPDTPHANAPPAGPTYSTSRMNGLPSLAFDGIAGLWTEGSLTRIVRGAQSKSLIPTGLFSDTGVDAPSFAIYIVFATDSDDPGTLFHFTGLDPANPILGPPYPGLGKIVAVNAAQDPSSDIDFVASPGDVFVRWEVDASGIGSSGSGSFKRPIEDDFQSRSQGTGACILSIVDDGNAKNGPGGTNTESLYRVNGRPIDRWWSLPMQNYKWPRNPAHPHCLGWSCPIGGTATHLCDNFIGHIREVIVLRRSDPRATTGDFAHVVDHSTGASALNVYGRIPFSGATWTTGANTIDVSGGTGTFAGYVFQAGDQIEITAGTGATLGTYTIASRTSDTVITLTGSIGPNNTDTAGFIYSVLDGTAQDAEEMTQIEGYLAHRSGLQHLLERETANAAETPHPFGLTNDFGSSDALASPPDADTGNPSDVGSTGLNFGMVTKYSSEGLFVWSYNYKTANDYVETAADRGGVGYSVVAKRLEGETDVGVWCAGAQATTFHGTIGDTSVRRIIDKGDTFSLASGDGAWIYQDSPTPRYPAYFWPRMDVDKFGSLYYPYTHWTDHTFIVFDKAGSAGVANEILSWLTSLATTTALAIHHDPNMPDYGDGSSIELAEFVTYISGTQVTSKESLYRHSLVSVTARTGSARTITNLAIALPDIKTFTVSGVVATPTGGSAALDANSEFAMIVPFNKTGDAVFLDGVSPYKVYRAREGDVEELVAETSGEIPKRAKLACEWRSRLVLANFPDNPGGYAMSAMGNIRDWDFYPAVISATSAVLGQLARAEDVPAIITALIPAREDLLIVGGYNSIWRMTGDPQDGGQLDKLSDEMGIAFGRAWAKDPDGRIFFFGLNPPGIYTLGASGEVVNVTQHTIEETEFAEIDFSEYNVLLAWNPVDRGIHVTLQPRSAVVGAAERHWFWEEKSNDISRTAPVWSDTFGHEDVSPMVMRHLEGDDKGSRAFVVAGYDGKLRAWDPDALDDDGYGIDAYFDIVVARQTSRVEVMLTETRVTLAPDQDGARLELYANDVADRMGPIRHSVELTPGPKSFRKRVRGENIWIRIRNANANQRFAFESAWVNLTGPQIQRK